MSDIDRGAYAPQTDGPLTFDARTPRQSRPLPFTLIFSAVVLVALVVAVVLFYRGGVREAGAAPQTVGQPVIAMKEAPVAEETAALDEAEALDVYVERGEAAAPVDEKPAFAPPPEEPQPRPAPRPAPVQVAEARESGPPAQPALRPAQSPVSADAGSVARSSPVIRSGAEIAQIDAAARPRPAATAMAAAAAASVAATGNYGVQIGAFSSQALADSQFAEVVGGYPTYASGKPKSVTPVERNGATLYRTIVAGFSKSQADAFCAELKSTGRQCLVKAAS